MIVVETELRASPIHGIGLFASVPIEKGEVLLRPHALIDLEIPLSRLLGAPREIRDFFDTYGTVWDDKLSFAMDDSRFMNHSFRPNTRIAWDGDQWYYNALRDIEAGEELTCDYRDIDQAFDSYSHTLKNQ